MAHNQIFKAQTARDIFGQSAIESARRLVGLSTIESARRIVGLSAIETLKLNSFTNCPPKLAPHTAPYTAPQFHPPLKRSNWWIEINKKGHMSIRWRETNLSGETKKRKKTIRCEHKQRIQSMAHNNATLNEVLDYIKSYKNI